MTQDEFIQQAEDSRRREGRCGLLLMGVFLLMAVTGVPLVNYLDLEQPNAGKIIVLALYAIAIFGLARLSLNQQLKFTLKCPHCSKMLAGYSVQIVVASGNCGHCGKQIISDGSHAPL
ncbi:MAG: hypothetical protein HZA89_18580 [Verrucomicrobia bacterium]|nr:hypothetical protein [Verrucomicrobiota bacterium]